MTARVAYFSMEIALSPAVPTYSGGLGVLAGDTIRAAADLKVPMVAVTLLHRKGYFRQLLDATGQQEEYPTEWHPEDYLKELPQRATVEVEGRTVHLRAWLFEVVSHSGFTVPVYLIDTELPENGEYDSKLTQTLYGGDLLYRLCQETVLGIGGVRMLRALGHDGITRFHLNEGHAALLTVELLDESARRAERSTFTHADVNAVRKQCVFTTHTPVPAGHDKFPMEMACEVLRRPEIELMQDVFCHDGMLNLTYVALNLSNYANGVAKRHGEVSRLMFAQYQIDAITNGVHVPTWTSPPFAKLFDRYVPGWRQDSLSLRYALGIPPQDIWNAHAEVKRMLIDYVNSHSDAKMDENILTLGFARRATGYKRADLLLSDPARLQAIAEKCGKLQIVYAGKAHPKDFEGKELIRRIFAVSAQLKGKVNIVYLNGYEWALGALMTAGADVWINTPQPPQEASGTSGMKAAINGVPSLSMLDGWWLEGCIEGKTGWAIDPGIMAVEGEDSSLADAAALYAKLETRVAPLYYGNRAGFIDVMTYAIALNGSFFNTQRMVQEYVVKAYLG